MVPKADLLGLLTSQVGYEVHLPRRAVVRSSSRDRFMGTPEVVVSRRGTPVASIRAEYWGELWHSHWWVADLGVVSEPGVYQTQLRSGTAGVDTPGEERGGDWWPGDDIEVGRGLLWDRIVELAAIDQLERRSRFADAKVGWMDAGMPWFELNAHASTILALCEVMTLVPGRLSEGQRERMVRQIVNGCDYLVLLQEEARRRGKPEGSLSHQVPRFEDAVTRPDAAKAAAALATSSRVLAKLRPERSADYQARAERALKYAMSRGTEAAVGFNWHQRGLPESYAPPPEGVRTRDLLMNARAALELVRQGRREYVDVAAGLLAKVLARQACESELLHGLWGWFYEFDDRHHPEPAWAHQIVGKVVGDDLGATHAYDVGVLLQAIDVLPDHAEVNRWRDAVRAFAYGFFLPACSQNPFFLVPHLLHRDEGLITFAGPWHGTNCIYGQAAALAFDLARFFGDANFLPVATGNLQWLCGLNAGVHRENLAFCHMFSADVPDGRVLPASMIHGVGHRCAGGWLMLRGSVTNGFSVGEQFQFDAPAKRDVDGPHSLSDEDWIPHAAALVSALCRV